MLELLLGLFTSTLRLSTPLVFAAMGGLLCERSGIATICLEGVMLVGAFTAAAVNVFWGDPWLATVAGVVCAGIAMSLHAFLSVAAKSDQIVSAVAVNLVASGITPFLTKRLFGSPTNSPSLPMELRLESWILVVTALVLPLAVHAGLYFTRPGLRLRAAGDGPDALRTAGVSVARTRWAALFVGGLVTGLGGVYLSISHTSQFTRDMTAGRGFIALTALIFGKWKPLPALAACLFFGFTDALQIRLQSTPIFGVQFPVQAIQALPYVVTLLVLVGFIGDARAPLAIGHRD